MSEIQQLVARSFEGSSHDDDVVARLAAWVERVAAWNDKIDLTAARDERELVDLMMADAMILGGELEQGARVVDVGCGAGAPGLPLAMLRPDLAVTLVEPMQKRVALLRLCAGALPAAQRPQVLQMRGDALLAHSDFQPFDAAISRATLPPAEWLALGAELAPGGQVWVLLAQADAPRLAGWRLDTERRYRWPLTDAERRAVSYRQNPDERSSIG